MIASRANIQTARGRLREFYDHCGTSNRTEKSYFVVRGDDITYLFDGGEDSTEFLSEIINNGSISRRVGTRIIQHAHQLQPFFRFLPNLEVASLSVPAENSPSLIILRSRMSLFNFHDKTVYKFPIAGDPELDDAIQARLEIPPDVNAPELIDVDRTFPFVCEGFVTGQTVRSTIASWPYVLSALQNLTHLYRSQELKDVPIDDVLANFHDREDEPLVRQALRGLESLSLPNTLTVGQIHGDLAVRNLRYDGDTVYILDWQDCRQDLLIHDFFRPIHRIASKRDRPELFIQMVTGEGKPNAIATEYSQHIGSLAFGDKTFHEGLPLLYLLCAFDSPTIGTGNWWKNTVEAILDKLDTSSNNEKYD